MHQSIIVYYQLIIKRAAECGGIAQRDPIIINSITVQLLFTFTASTFFRIANELWNMLMLLIASNNYIFGLFYIERAAECCSAAQRNPIITNSITVQLLFEYIFISLFFVSVEFWGFECYILHRTIIVR